MQGNLSHSTSGNAHAVSLGPNHGYRFEGDMAFLNAELAIGARGVTPHQNWALQLWACDAPYQGGPLRGIKVAEAALALDGAYDPSHLEAGAPAQLPPVQRDYAMVLVLASGDRGAYDQVHDFSNYAARQTFEGPHLSGSVGYRFEADQVVLQAGSVRNPRAPENLSGTLALELWALRYPYEGGSVGDGTRIAQVELGQLAGQQEQDGLEYRLQRCEPPAGEWQLALLLREWTEVGYQTRDYCNFPVAYRAEDTVREAQPSKEPQYAREVAVDAEPAVRVVNAPVPVSEPLRAPAAPKAAEPVKAAEPAKVVAAVKGATVKAAEPAKAVAPAKAAEPAKVVASAPAARADGKVSISTASVEALSAVKGLNLKLAQSIVRARPFSSLEDLKAVRGIGDKLLQKLRAQLTL
jgi:competence ComEA-like helix-hairpin-helix protein